MLGTSKRFTKNYGNYAFRGHGRRRAALLLSYGWVSMRAARGARSGQIPLAGTRFAYPSAPRMRFMLEETFLAGHYAILPPRTEAPLIVDVGANIGLVTRFFYELFPQASIVAIEPHPENASYLRSNLARGGASDAQILEAALAPEASRLFVEGDGIDARVTLEEAPGRREVASVTFEQVVSPGTRVDILKLDIEGAELGVLRDIGERLADVDQLVAEVHQWRDRPDPLPEILKLLEATGHSYEIPFWDRGPNGGTCILRSWREPLDERSSRMQV